MPLTTGQILQSRYRAIYLLGQGGMGAVYRAWDTRLKMPVAVKEMIAQPGLDPHTLTQLGQQFKQEATILARLDHPHLVDVIDFFEEGGNAYLVMKFIEGDSLAERIEREGALPEDQVLAWASQLLDALAYCHSQGVIHRDVKPQNVIIRPNGGTVLVDFGLLKLWDPHDPQTKTAMRGMGTPEYAPPEQYDLDAGHTDPRSDLYSLGATLYHALTGQAPPTATRRIANRNAFQPPRMLNVQISQSTETAVLRAMELTVDDRFPTAREMTAALKGEAVPTQPAGPLTRRRVPTWVWALGGLAVLALAIGLTMGLGGMGAGSRPTPTPSAIPTNIPTHTPPRAPTRGSSSTQTPTRVPTEIPTSVSSPASIPTKVPTSTPGPIPTASPIPAPRIISPELLRPSQGSRLQNPIVFQWRGSLDAGQAYRVTVYHVGSGDTLQSNLLTDLSWTADLPADKFGGWNWRVSVIQGGVEVATSAEWGFWFSPFASPLATPSP